MGRPIPPASIAGRARGFPKDQALPVGKWVRFLNDQGKGRLVRIVEVCGPTVVVDTNHRAAGQAMELEVRLISIQAPGS